MSENDFDDNFDDLTEEQKEKYLKNTNPDAPSEDKYKWSEDFQRNIIGLILNDRWFAVQCKDIVNPNYFLEEVHQLLCRMLFAYLDAYRVLPPKSYMMQEVLNATEKKESEIKVHYIGETNLVYDKYVPNLETRESYLDKILNFAKLMSLKSAFDKSLQLMKKDPEGDSTWAKIQDVLKEALLVDRNFNEGLNYFETFEERYDRMSKEEEAQEHFTSGFKSIDDALLGGGTHRGEIYSWIGLSGTGKSLALVTAALKNVKELGKRVLYVSLEMDEDKIAERFDAQLSDQNINALQENKELVKKSFEDFASNHDDKKLLVIKQFPAGSMNVNTLRAYMQQLNMTGFTPDLLIIDYIGEMKDYPDMPTYESRYKIVRDLRGLATEERVCIFTAMQPNKNAREAQKKDGPGDGVIDDTNLADSYGQIRPLDGCWSINQMQAEKDAGIARIFVIKHRHGKSRFTFHVEYNMNTLAMEQISNEKYNQIWKKFSFEKTNKESDMDRQSNEIMKKMKKKKLDDIGYNTDLDNDEQTGEEND
jgi:replicative DNA helicase